MEHSSLPKHQMLVYDGDNLEYMVLGISGCRGRRAYAKSYCYTEDHSHLYRLSFEPYFPNKVIKRYIAFGDFYGMEECIEQIVSFFRYAAQDLEEKKQILYLLGPVGGGQS